MNRVRGVLAAVALTAAAVPVGAQGVPLPTTPTPVDTARIVAGDTARIADSLDSPRTIPAVDSARVVAAANELDAQYSKQIISANDRADKLGRSTFLHKAVTLVGGAVGGGLATVFGLQASSNSGDKSQSAGRNAAYSGAVAAVFTLVDKIWSTSSDEGEEQACKDVAAQFNKVKDDLRDWRNQAGDAAFRATFNTVYQTFTSTIEKTVNNSKCRYSLKEQLTTEHRMTLTRLMR
jgi:hypothetical protein